jgi:hypothetical protein
VCQKTGCGCSPFCYYPEKHQKFLSLGLTGFRLKSIWSKITLGTVFPGEEGSHREPTPTRLHPVGSGGMQPFQSRCGLDRQWPLAFTARLSLPVRSRGPGLRRRGTNTVSLVSKVRNWNALELGETLFRGEGVGLTDLAPKADSGLAPGREAELPPRRVRSQSLTLGARRWKCFQMRKSLPFARLI